MTTLKPAEPHFDVPSVPGTSAKYLGGPPMRHYMLLFALTTISFGALYSGLGNILLPRQIQDIEFTRWFTGPDASANLQELTNLKAQIARGAATATPTQEHQLHLLAKYESAKAGGLSLVTGIGVFVTMFIQPVVGVLSDRTRSRWGRRAPWIACGAVLGAALVLGLRYSTSIGLMIAFWSLAQVVLNMGQGPLTTTVADRVPEQRIGAVSGLAGLGGWAGIAFGAVVAGALFGAIGLDSYYVFAIALAVMGVLFVLTVRDSSSTELEVPAAKWTDILKSFLIPLRDADYRMVWIAKVVMLFGYGVATAFGIYMMQSYVQPALSAEEATRLTPIMTMVALPGTLIAMVVAGRWSDRIGRRKPFVIWASVLCAASMLVPLIWPSLPALFIQSIVGGVAIGSYLVVDQALFIDVLPDKQAAGRDLGMGGLAGNLGQALAPLVGGQIVALTGGYRIVWPVAMVLVLIAAAAIVPVKKIK
ncbi:MFS transporter [Streptomyces fractus]|uniref:MFS transporter n=1 Tax=Streptomyces fractus TaxID=641806 RepID=UPI003CE8DC67